MLTAQEIKEKTLEKAVFGGYDATSVDDFLDAIALDYAALEKENSVLKVKMKVLVDKIEDYHANEDAMRMALVAAQKLSSQIEGEARGKADKMLGEARAESERVLGGIKAEAEAEEARLVEAKRVSAKFIEDMRAVCDRQLDMLDRLSAIIPAVHDKKPDEIESPTVDISETVRSIEAGVARAASESSHKMDIGPEIDASAAGQEGGEDGTRLFALSNKG